MLRPSTSSRRCGPTPTYRLDPGRLDTDSGYQVLYRRLTGQPAVVAPPVGPIVEMPPIHPGTPASPSRVAISRLPATGETKIREIKGQSTLRVPALQNIPFDSLGSLFIGREALLAQLSEALGATALVQKQVLYGQAGIGKTRLAVEYAWRSAARYTARLFVRADSPGALRSGLARLAGPEALDLRLDLIPEDDARIGVLRWLRERGDWLLILDNVDTPAVADEVKALLPQLSNGHVILTSRLSRWPRDIRKWHLEQLASEDAVRYLLEATEGERHTKAGENVTVGELMRLLRGMPMALEQAAAYIRVHGITFEQYLAEWTRRRRSVLQWHDPDEMSYPIAVAVTWETSFAQVDVTARALLRLFAYMGTDQILMVMPESQKELVSEAVAQMAKETGGDIGLVQVDRAVADLVRYSLVTRDQDALAVHPILQEVIRGQIPEGTRRLWVQMARRVVMSFVKEVQAASNKGPEANRMLLLYGAGRTLLASAPGLMRGYLESAEARWGGDHPDMASLRRDVEHVEKHVQAWCDREADPTDENPKREDPVPPATDDANVPVNIVSEDPPSSVDAILITAITREREAVLEELRAQQLDPVLTKHGGRYSHTFALPRPSQDALRCLVAQPTDKGPHATQSLTIDLLRTFEPGFVLLVGVAGGLDERGVAEGDVIVARRVYNYEPVRLKVSGPEERPEPYRCSAQVIDLAQALAAGGAFVGVLEGRRIHVRDYASGEKVLMDRGSELRQRLLELSPDVYGFEMEGHGLLHSVWEAARERNVQCGVIKSVSDFGDAGMSDGKAERQREASRRAARLALELLRHF